MWVLSPVGVSLNSVSIATIAPTPWPFDDSFAYSIGRSSSFSKLKLSFRPPIPSGTFTEAFQWRSSWISKLSTPGRSFAIFSGSFRTSHTSWAGASNSLVPSTFIR